MSFSMSHRGGLVSRISWLTVLRRRVLLAAKNQKVTSPRRAHQKWRLIKSLLVAVVSTVGILDSVSTVSFAEAQAAQKERRRDPIEPEIPPGPLRASLDYNLISRASSSFRFWDEDRDTYRDGYVNPRDYELRLNACASSGGSYPLSGRPVPIRRFTWTLEALDEPSATPVTLTADPDKCESIVRLARLGHYRIGLTVLNDQGKVAAAEAITTLRDLLVVAIGDSFASAEGNPDRPLPELRWLDRQCHRSAYSALFLAAAALERRDTSVTFLSVACSGATIDNALYTLYSGQESDNDRKLRTQLSVLRDVIGDPDSLSTRQVDVLLIAIGVNDAGISAVLEECAFPGFDIDRPLVDIRCSSDQRLGRFVDTALRPLPFAYERLDVGIAHHLRAASVVITEYPAFVFTDQHMRFGGCGAFEFVDPTEAQWLALKGSDLNRVIRRAASRNGWIYGGGVAQRFQGHGYCADSASWFRTWSESRERQGDKLGTAHPNEAGHEAVAKSLLAAIPESRTAPPPADITVEFTRVRLDDKYSEDTVPGVEITRTPIGRAVSLGVAWKGRHRIPADPQQALKINELNRWIVLDPNEHRFNFSVAGNSFAVEAASVLPGIRVKDDTGQAPKGFFISGLRPVGRFVIHRRADRWGGAGLHRQRSATVNGAAIEIEYRVTVRPNRFINDLIGNKTKR
jgi:hypothetical protein